jgi:hypothetical protein
MSSTSDFGQALHKLFGKLRVTDGFDERRLRVTSRQQLKAISQLRASHRKNLEQKRKEKIRNKNKVIPVSGDDHASSHANPQCHQDESRESNISQRDPSITASMKHIANIFNRTGSQGAVAGAVAASDPYSKTGISRHGIGRPPSAFSSLKSMALNFSQHNDIINIKDEQNFKLALTHPTILKFLRFFMIAQGTGNMLDFYLDVAEIRGLQRELYYTEAYELWLQVAKKYLLVNAPQPGK